MGDLEQTNGERLIKRDFYEGSGKKRFILKKDIVIPAGTEFSPAPKKTVRFHNDYHVEAVIGMTDNTSGEVGYFVDPDYMEELAEWFEEVK